MPNSENNEELSAKLKRALEALLENRKKEDNKKEESSFLESVKTDQRDKIKRFLQDNPDLVNRAKDEKGNTALHLAAINGHKGVVNLLKDSKADVHAINSDNKTASQLAGDNRHQVLKNIIEYYAETTPKIQSSSDARSSRSSSFSSEVSGGDDEFHDALAGSGTDLDDQLEKITGAEIDAEEGSDHLGAGATVDKKAIDLALTNQKIHDILQADKNGSTPLSSRNSVDEEEFYDALEGDENVRNTESDVGEEKFGDTIEGNGKVPSMEGRYQELKGYISLGDINHFRELLEEFDINYQDRDGLTLLHHSAAENQLEFTKELLTLNSNINTFDNEGFTPLHWAAAEGHVDTVKFLVENGADINAKDGEDLTPLHLATIEGHTNIVELLVGEGATVDPDIQDILTQAKANNDQLLDAAENGDIEGVTQGQYTQSNNHTSGEQSVEIEVGQKDLRLQENNKEVHQEQIDSDARATSDNIAAVIEQGHFGNSAPQKDRLQGPLSFKRLRNSSSVPVNRGLGTQLLDAATEGDSERVKEALGRGADINARDRHGATPLHLAASKGHVEVVTELLNRGADVNAVDKLKLTPLQYARTFEKAEVVTKLLNRGAEDSMTPVEGADYKLLEAVRNGALKEVKKILKLDVNAVTINTALRLAAQNGYVKVVRKLLKSGAEVNAVDYFKNTALHLAAQNGHAEVVTELLKNGANIDAKGINDKSALRLAAQNGHAKVVTELLKNRGAALTDKNAALRLAAQNGYVKVVTELLKNGAEVNAVDSLGNTVLHSAAQNGHAEVVTELLNRGADVNAVDELNRTPLHLAAKNNYREVVTELLKSGAEINAVDKNRYTALCWAAQNGALDLVNTLLERHAIVNVGGKSTLCLAAQNGHAEVVTELLNRGAALTDKNAALRLAAEEGYIEIVSKLLNEEANINDQDKWGYTALRLAVENRHAEVVTELLKSGAEVNAVDKLNRTPLHLAAKNNYREVVVDLWDAGSNFDAVDGEGKTALYLAAEEGHKEMVMFLVNLGVNIGNNVFKMVQEQKSKGGKVDKKFEEIEGVFKNKILADIKEREQWNEELLKVLLESEAIKDVIDERFVNEVLELAGQQDKNNIVELLNKIKDIDRIIDDVKHPLIDEKQTFTAENKQATIQELPIPPQSIATPIAGNSVADGSKEESKNETPNILVPPPLLSKKVKIETERRYQTLKEIIEDPSKNLEDFIEKEKSSWCGPNYKGEDGYTLLCHSFLNDKTDIADRLIELGENVDIALRVAAEKGPIALVQKLLKAGVVINDLDTQRLVIGQINTSYAAEKISIDESKKIIQLIHNHMPLTGSVMDSLPAELTPMAAGYSQNPIQMVEESQDTTLAQSQEGVVIRAVAGAGDNQESVLNQEDKGLQANTTQPQHVSSIDTAAHDEREKDETLGAEPQTQRTAQDREKGLLSRFSQALNRINVWGRSPSQKGNDQFESDKLDASQVKETQKSSVEPERHRQHENSTFVDRNSHNSQNSSLSQKGGLPELPKEQVAQASDMSKVKWNNIPGIHEVTKKYMETVFDNKKSLDKAAVKDARDKFIQQFPTPKNRNEEYKKVLSSISEMVKTEVKKEDGSTKSEIPLKNNQEIIIDRRNSKLDITIPEGYTGIITDYFTHSHLVIHNGEIQDLALGESGHRFGQIQAVGRDGKTRALDFSQVSEVAASDPLRDRTINKKNAIGGR